MPLLLDNLTSYLALGEKKINTISEVIPTMEYPKINSLWKREGWYFCEEKKKNPTYQKSRQSFLVGDYACLEFGNVKLWSVEEKIDGTNVRIVYQHGQVSFWGRTKDSQMPCHLLAMLQDKFTPDLIRDTFTLSETQESVEIGQDSKIILYGEGYGAKIQKGGENYRPDVGFILFDVYIDSWWLRRESVREIAHKLCIQSAPSLGIMPEDKIVELVKQEPMSLCSVQPRPMEGLVCRAEPLILFRNGKPIIFKLKCKDFS